MVAQLNKIWTTLRQDIMHNLQSKTPFSRCSRVIILMIATGFWTVDCQAQLGHVLSGVGPVDQAMAGAGTANPQGGLGALHWNPASITTFETSEFSLGVQLLFPPPHSRRAP